MYIVSIKMTKKKIVIGLVTIVAVFAIVVGIVSAASGSGDVQSTLSFNITAEDEHDRAQFLSQFGWEISSEPVEVMEIIIPEVFDETYENYNEIQKEQGFDLSDYSGMRVKKWTYSVTNYPGGEGNEFANILVYENKVIGGDISSGSQNGFMHGFKPTQTPTDTDELQSSSSSVSE